MLRNIVWVWALLAVAAAPALWAEDFDPTGWDTNTDYDIVGSPEAKKGGLLRDWWPSYPATLRAMGPNSNQGTTRTMRGMIYESLVGLHPTDLSHIPFLATHWKISEDKRTFSFHINPKARWADGSEVTSEDVVETWKFRIREDLKDYYSRMLYFESFEEPKAESKYIVSVKTKKLHWRLFLYFSGMYIWPAKYVKGLDAEKYLAADWTAPMGTGPYELLPEDIKSEHSITLTRRTDYWAENERWNVGGNNFDKVRWIIIRDQELAWEKFRENELDFYVVSKAHRWHKDCDFKKIKKGWIQKRKIYTQAAQGTSGYVFNMRKKPFNDRNVRKAFCYLVNRERLIDKLFFNEYVFIDSYWPGGIFANPKNPKIRYNPRRAARLLAKAGWSERNEDGWLVKDGKIFELTLSYGSQPWTRIHGVIKEDLAKAGIKLELKLTDPRTIMKNMDERNFKIHFQGWGALEFPNPESSWHSRLADQKSNNNLAGFADPRVDKLCAEYDLAFDRKDQIRLVRQMDRLIFNAHPYALAWRSGFTRVLFWNKFGHPKTYFSRIGDSRAIKGSWWMDQEKKETLEAAMKSGSQLPVGKVIQKPWEGFKLFADDEDEKK